MKRLPPITDIINFLAINPLLATGGMPTIDQVQALAEAGFEVVINLALDQSPDAIPEEEVVVTRLGMRYIHIPVIWKHPQLSDLEKFFDSMQQFSSSKIFVHCVLNLRVSVFVYLYRVIVLREVSTIAHADLLKIWQPDDIWQAFIDQTLKKVTSQ